MMGCGLTCEDTCPDILSRIGMEVYIKPYWVAIEKGVHYFHSAFDKRYIFINRSNRNGRP
jgi:hypothetical protein